MSNWPNGKVIDFINEIHLNPALWDVETKEYKDRNAKKSGWAFIADKFNITSDEAYKKFRSLRTYAKNEQKKMRSGNGEGKHPTWFAYDAISFILSRGIPEIEMDNENTTQTDKIELSSGGVDLNQQGDEAGYTNNTFTLLEGGGSKKPAYSPALMQPPTKKKADQDKIHAIEPAISKLQNVTEKRYQEDQYDRFGKHIAAQLREMPLRSFIILQDTIQGLITQERLNCLDNP